MVATDMRLEGSYLHYNHKDLIWIRSGKAVGSDETSVTNGLMKRNEAHKMKAASSALFDGECLYTLYPLQNNKSQLHNKVGYFEELSLYCGFSFNRNEGVEGLVLTEYDNGLFDWTVYIRQLEKTNIRGCATLREKQLVIIGYFFKLCYDICLSPRHNVSNNPGFESVIGVFNNANLA